MLRGDSMAKVPKRSMSKSKKIMMKYERIEVIQMVFTVFRMHLVFGIVLGTKKRTVFKIFILKKIIFSYKFCSSDSQKKGGGGGRGGEGSVQCCHNTRINAG